MDHVFLDTGSKYCIFAAFTATLDIHWIALRDLSIQCTIKPAIHPEVVYKLFVTIVDVTKWNTLKITNLFSVNSNFFTSNECD